MEEQEPRGEGRALLLLQGATVFTLNGFATTLTLDKRTVVEGEALEGEADLDPRCLLGRGPSCAPPLYRPSIPKIHVSDLPKSRGVRRENSFYSLNFPMSYISICRCTNYRDLIC